MNQDEWAREKSRRCIKEVFTAAWKQYVGIQLRNKEMDSWPHWRHWGFLESVKNSGSISRMDGPYSQRKWLQTVQVPTPLEVHVQLHWFSEASWGLKMLTLELLSSFSLFSSCIYGFASERSLKFKSYFFPSLSCLGFNQLLGISGFILRTIIIWTTCKVYKVPQIRNEGVSSSHGHRALEKERSLLPEPDWVGEISILS